MKKALLIAGTALALVCLGAAGWYFAGPRHSPSGQPALTALRSDNLDRFQQAFDESSGSVRVVLLLSPT